MNSFDILKSINKKNKETTLKKSTYKKYSLRRIIKFLFRKYLHYVWKRNRILEQEKEELMHKDYIYDDNRDTETKENNLSIVEFFKNVLKIIFKVILWIIPLLICALFYDNYNNNVPFYIVFGAYIFWTNIYIQSKKDNEYWKLLALGEDTTGEFYKRFLAVYNPINFRILLFMVIFIPFKILTTIQYISLFFLICISEILYRRYLTLDLKLDLLLETKPKITKHSDLESINNNEY